MNRKWITAMMLGVAVLTGTPSASADSSVEPVGQHAFLYMDTHETQLTESVRAVNMKDGTIALFDQNGNRKMAMKNIDAAKGGVGFYVRELRVPTEIDKRFWEIFATVGAHDKNCGYWLISEENGKWRFELMVEDLIAVGYKPMEWHLLSSKVEDGTTMPDGDYRQLLRETAMTALFENKRLFQMETEAIPESGYAFGTDYDLGDIVTCRDSYGFSANCTVSEIREVEDESGYRLIPVLSYEGAI